MTTKMTTEQFAEWAAQTFFTATLDIDGQTVVEKLCGYDDDGDPIFACCVQAYAWKTLSADLPSGEKFEVSYSKAVEWVGSTVERHTDDYEVSDVGEGSETWQMSGIELVDEDGDALTDIDRDMILAGVLCSEHPQDISDIDFESLIPAVVTEDIGIDEDENMETITLENDNAPSIRFVGEEVASASSSSNNASSYYSGTVGRWTVLKLYKTKGGKFVAQSIGHTQWQGEHDRYKSVVCADEAAVIEFFGHGWLAKLLYEEAGIEDATEVD